MGKNGGGKKYKDRKTGRNEPSPSNYTYTLWMQRGRGGLIPDKNTLATSKQGYQLRYWGIFSNGRGEMHRVMSNLEVLSSFYQFQVLTWMSRIARILLELHIVNYKEPHHFGGAAMRCGSGSKTDVQLRWTKKMSQIVTVFLTFLVQFYTNLIQKN
jgi:hypothetical protein